MNHAAPEETTSSHTCGDVPKASARHDVNHTHVNGPIDMSGYEFIYNPITHRVVCRVGGVVVNASPHDD